VTAVPGPLLLTPEEAATVLRIGRTRLYELLAAGDLPSVKLGGSRRIAVAALERYVEALAGSLDDGRHTDTPAQPVTPPWHAGPQQASRRTRPPRSEPSSEALPLPFPQKDEM
jgi:excisionase family DNA binding protein